MTWPMYTEQQLNAFEMVVDLDLAVELRLDYMNELGGNGDRVELVAAEEIERAVSSTYAEKLLSYEYSFDPLCQKSF
ncbi:UDP-glycosyltransferase 71C5 [Camellia lanceoleosa]|uniref:UDP-glycosyltransferase 71C5 n=1 Tax=Camellia lanceoleosa TaxID=1840588 RepID=A0ACC0IEE8_9ERIC|nr:UDP-glycosyltransferase 71C5 [Camellia lanceoleosa]